MIASGIKSSLLKMLKSAAILFKWCEITPASLYETFWYTCLSICAWFLFIQNNIEDFKSGKTSYSERPEPLTPNDLPTLAVCWKWENPNLVGH